MRKDREIDTGDFIQKRGKPDGYVLLVTKSGASLKNIEAVNPIDGEAYDAEGVDFVKFAVISHEKARDAIRAKTERGQDKDFGKVGCAVITARTNTGASVNICVKSEEKTYFDDTITYKHLLEVQGKVNEIVAYVKEKRDTSGLSRRR